jgi:hypothetical protein
LAGVPEHPLPEVSLFPVRLPMIHPTDHQFSLPIAVRDGQGAPVTCATCGCRLQAVDGTAAWRHFNPLGGRDARGCRIDCADATHGPDGRPFPQA